MPSFITGGTRDGSRLSLQAGLCYRRNERAHRLPGSSMLDFAHPLFLLLILPLPLVIWRWLRRPIAALPYSDTRLLVKLPSRDARLSVWVGAGLRGLALLLIVVGLEGPRWPDRGSRIPTGG